MEDAAKRYQLLRGRLYQKLPLLALALGLLDWKESDRVGTDGVWFYAPQVFLEKAVRAPEDAERTLLHSVLHAMLAHPWERERPDGKMWDLACDLTVEFLARRLLREPIDGALGTLYYALAEGTAFSAPAVYTRLCAGLPELDAVQAQMLQKDSHTFWQNAQSSAKLPAASADGEGLQALWKRQEEKLKPYLQTPRPKIGTGTAGAELTLGEVPKNEEKFRELLRIFSVVRENRHVNDADFAYSWYAYGMEHYDGMPLIEPLEYSEERKLRELAIVLDTSASCSRGLTAWFLGAVRAIVLRERLFFERFRLYILQCDCEVQQDTLITNPEEFQWYLEHLELYGGGGTDFRPAFRRIDELVAQGELPRLGGVLYFTDGYGVFPERAPEYPVAFVMLRYRYDDINIPRWAMKLILDAEKPGRDEGWI